MNLFTKKRQRMKEWGEGIVREFGIKMYTLLYLNV